MNETQKKDLKQKYMDKFNFIELYRPEQESINWWINELDQSLKSERERLAKEVGELKISNDNTTEKIHFNYAIDQVLQIIKK